MSKVRFVDSSIRVNSGGGEDGGGSSISSSYALSASHADFATSASYAEYAVSASHEITKEVSSSYADTASLALSGNGPFTGSFTGSFIGNGTGLFSGSFSGSIPDAYQIISGSVSASISPDNGLRINSPVDITMPSGSVFTIHEPDIDQENRLDFRFDQGNPMLEIASRFTTSSLYLRSNQTDNGLIVESSGKIKFIASGATYAVQFTTTGFNPNAPGQLNLGAYNRRWKDFYINNGDKISFGVSDNSDIDLVSFRHTANTNTLVMSGSSDVLLNVKGAISASGDISGSDLRVRDGRFSRDGGAAEIEIIASEAAGGIIGTQTSDNLLFRRFNIPKFTISESRNFSHQRLDVEGDIEATGIISASKMTVSASSDAEPGYTFWNNSTTGMLSTSPTNLKFQIDGTGSPELELTTGQATFRVPVSLNDNEISSVSRIRALGSISASGDFSSSISSTASFGTYLGDGSQLTGIETDPFPYTGSAIISGSLQIKGSGNTFATTPILIENSDGDDLIKVLDSGRFFIGKGANNAADTNVVYGNSANAQGSNNIAIGNSAQTQGGQYSIAIGGTVASVNYGIGIGSAYIGGAESVGVGYSSRTSAGTVAIGHDSGPEGAGDGEQSIYIGNEAKGTADNSIVLNANGGSTISSATETNSFKVFMSSASTPDFQVTNTNITASGNISGSSTSTASFGTYLGDGSQLTGIEAASGKFGIANASGSYTYYSDLSSSLQAATSGDTIQLFTTVTESSDHSYHLKSGVNFNFNGNELFYETSTSSGLEVFTDNGAQVTCSFYNGRVRFNQPGAGTNNLIKMTGAGTQINSVGFEWEVMEGTSYAIYLEASNSALDGGKFIANSGYANYFIRQYYTEIRNVEIVTYGATATFSYGFNDTTSNYPRVKNSTIYGYFDDVENKPLFFQNSTGLHLEGNNIYLRGKSTGTKSYVTNNGDEFIGNIINTKNANGITCKSSIGNTIFVETGDFGLTVSSEVVGGSIDILSGQALITANEVTSGVRVTGLSIRCKDFGGPAAQLGTNTSLMGCDLFDDYGSSDANIVEVKTGCTGVEIANCTFDFMNAAGRVGNIGITAVDDGTVVKFANNTIMGGTLFNPTKVTQGILNTPDAQGNMSMTF